MSISDQPKVHVHDEFQHALIIRGRSIILGKMPVVTPKPVRASGNSRRSGPPGGIASIGTPLARMLPSVIGSIVSLTCGRELWVSQTCPRNDNG
jgi:hypothetical protein